MNFYQGKKEALATKSTRENDIFVYMYIYTQ